MSAPLRKQDTLTLKKAMHVLQTCTENPRGTTCWFRLNKFQLPKIKYIKINLCI